MFIEQFVHVSQQVIYTLNQFRRIFIHDTAISMTQVTIKIKHNIFRMKNKKSITLPSKSELKEMIISHKKKTQTRIDKVLF